LNKLQILQEDISYTFSDAGLLELALTHRSASRDHLERMEFLGDAVLGLVISEALYARNPDADEGVLSRMRAHYVCRESLLTISREWGLADCLTVGKGERDARGVIKSGSIQADAVEAVIGAVFLDGGWHPSRAVVLSAWGRMLDEHPDPAGRDTKTRLQELVQAHGWGLPEYRLEDMGTDASPRFKATCSVQGREIGKGSGSRKKTAELRAAAEALDGLAEEGIG